MLPCGRQQSIRELKVFQTFPTAKDSRYECQANASHTQFFIFYGKKRSLQILPLKECINTQHSCFDAVYFIGRFAFLLNKIWRANME